MRTDDDVLLDLLGEALRPAVPAEPTLAELMALEEAVRFPVAPQSRRTPVRTKVLVALAGVGLLATSGTAFAVEQTGLPRPMRAAAYAVGLPIDSPGEHDARVALSRLREALRKGDDNGVRLAAAALRQHLADLPAADRRAVADPLLADAHARLQGEGAPDTAADPALSPPAQTTTTVTTGSTGGTTRDGTGVNQDTTTSAPARTDDQTTAPGTTPTTSAGDAPKPKPTDPKPTDVKPTDPKPDGSKPKAPKTDATTASSTTSTSTTSTTVRPPTPTTADGSSAGDPGDAGGDGESRGGDHGDHAGKDDQNDRRGAGAFARGLLNHE